MTLTPTPTPDRAHEVRSGIVATNGIELAYDERGAGPTILLIMGLGGQMVAWRDEFCDLLADRGVHVVRFDNRDIGLSTKIDAPAPTPGSLLARKMTGRRLTAPYRLTDMAADSVGLLDALEVDRAHVVGVSMGGMIAQTMAIEHGDRVASLCSIMSSTGNPRRGQAKPQVLAKMRQHQSRTRETAIEQSIEFFRLISGPHFDADDHRALVERSLERSPDPGADIAGTARQLAAIMASPDRTKALRRIDVPTLVVHGLVDPLIRPSGGMATAHAIADSRLLMFNDMGHDIPEPRRDELIDAMVENTKRARLTAVA